MEITYKNYLFDIQDIKHYPYYRVDIFVKSSTLNLKTKEEKEMWSFYATLNDDFTSEEIINDLKSGEEKRIEFALSVYTKSMEFWLNKIKDIYE